MDPNNIIICRCEEVTLQEVLETAETYQCSSREVKLRTRAGMGYCGGRTCRNLIDQVAGNMTKQPVPDEVPLGYQPPVRPISFKRLGGGQ